VVNADNASCAGGPEFTYGPKPTVTTTLHNFNIFASNCVVLVQSNRSVNSCRRIDQLIHYYTLWPTIQRENIIFVVFLVAYIWLAMWCMRKGTLLQTILHGSEFDSSAIRNSQMCVYLSWVCVSSKCLCFIRICAVLHVKKIFSFTLKIFLE